MELGKRTGSWIALSSALLLTLASRETSAQSTYTGPKWSELAGKFPLSASYDSLKRVWSNKDQGGRFGGTLLVLEAAILDYYVKGAGTFLQQQIINYLYPKTDPFKAATKTILDGIKSSESNIKASIEALWNRVHQEHSDMAFAQFDAAAASLEGFYDMDGFQRIDDANRVRFNQAIADLMTFKAWIERQHQPGDVIGNLQHYVIVVRLLVEATKEAEALAYLQPAYEMYRSQGQGYYEWLDSLSASRRDEIVQGAAAKAQLGVSRLLATGSGAVFDYLIGRNDELQAALVAMRDQRFVVQGNEPGYPTWWYRLDSESSVECWEREDDTCYYARDSGTLASGSFSDYLTTEPEYIIELHKWFEYNSMLMTVWTPIRIALDELWTIAGQDGYRPMTALDEDMDAYLYAESGLESELVGDAIPRDELADALDYLFSLTSSTHRREWSFIEGVALARGADFIRGAGYARYQNPLRDGFPTGAVWAEVLSQSRTVEEVEAYFRSQGHWMDRHASPNVFDAQAYLASYPDLQAAFGSDRDAAVEHWLTFGIDEGRTGAPWFDAAHYLAIHPDVAAAYGAGNYRGALEHFLDFGLAEGRASSTVFDVRYYLSQYPDLASAFGDDYAAALDHFLNFGLSEGRRASPSFDVAAYVNRYPDLQAAFGTNYRAALQHWFAHGMREGRNPGP